MVVRMIESPMLCPRQQTVVWERRKLLIEECPCKVSDNVVCNLKIWNLASILDCWFKIKNFRNMKINNLS